MTEQLKPDALARAIAALQRCDQEFKRQGRKDNPAAQALADIAAAPREVGSEVLTLREIWDAAGLQPKMVPTRGHVLSLLHFVRTIHVDAGKRQSQVSPAQYDGFADRVDKLMAALQPFAQAACEKKNQVDAPTILTEEHLQHAAKALAVFPNPFLEAKWMVNDRAWWIGFCEDLLTRVRELEDRNANVEIAEESDSPRIIH